MTTYAYIDNMVRRFEIEPEKLGTIDGNRIISVENLVDRYIVTVKCVVNAYDESMSYDKDYTLFKTKNTCKNYILKVYEDFSKDMTQAMKEDLMELDEFAET